MSDIVGVDTNWLVAIAVESHSLHVVAEQSWSDAVAAGQRIGAVPQVLSEFVHVVTDPRRFEEPCPFESALSFAENWWDAEEVAQLFPTAASVRLGWQWMRLHRLANELWIPNWLQLCSRMESRES
jgi:predicted nucleic acid-binding protein